MSPWWTGAAVGAAGVGAFAWAVRGRASSVFGESVYRGPSTRQSLALTFDDGPSESTPELLDLLDQHGARATFFMCGANVERLPQVARMVRERGHEIGNHTYSHARLDFKSAEFIYCEMARTQDAIEIAAGIRPVWFRAPYGVRWFGMGAAQRRLGLRGVMWTTIARDWRLPAGEVADRLTWGAPPGSILCLHDGRELQISPDVRSTIGALRVVLPDLCRLGYSFELIDSLLLK